MLQQNKTVMKPNNFIEAISIISESHSVELVINQPLDNGQVGDLSQPRLQIKNCPGSVVTALMEANFSLSMHQGMLYVDDYKKS